jgi:hypothetical protein
MVFYYIFRIPYIARVEPAHYHASFATQLVGYNQISISRALANSSQYPFCFPR